MSCSTTANRAKRAAKQAGIPETTGASLAERSRQVDFFALASPQVSFFEPLPRDTAVRVDPAFSPAELQQVSIQLLLGEAAVKRHLRQRDSATLSLDQRDPRPLDWAQSDQRCYDFLIGALRQARNGSGLIDLSGLDGEQRLELWEFSSHEAERLLRNLEHLQSGGSGVGGATSEYLTKNHQLLSRFYNHLAGQIEPLLPRDEMESIQAWRAL